MREFGIDRLLTISAFGVGSSNANVFLPMRLVLNHSPMAVGFTDHNAVEKLVREAGKGKEEGGWGLKWTLVRPCMLSDKEEMDIKVLGDDGHGAGHLPSVSRKSVATWVIREGIEKAEWVGRTPVLAN